MNWMTVNILTRRRNLCPHGQIIQTLSLGKWVDHVGLSQRDMVTGSVKGESVIFRRLHSVTLAYSKGTVGVAMFVPFEDIVTEMEKTISMLLEEVSQKVWQDMASLLDLGHRTTSCNYRMLCVAGQHPLY